MAKPAEKRHTRLVTFRLTAAEWQQLQAEAAKAKVKPSALIRHALRRLFDS